METAEVVRKIDEYLGKAEEENKYSIAGLALALDTDLDTLKLYERGLPREPEEGEAEADLYDGALSWAVKKARMAVLKWLTENSGSSRQSKDIFLMKNWFGYTDKQEKETAPVQLDLGEIEELGR